jgi:hypothetical protein
MLDGATMTLCDVFFPSGLFASEEDGGQRRHPSLKLGSVAQRHDLFPSKLLKVLRACF